MGIDKSVMKMAVCAGLCAVLALGAGCGRKGTGGEGGSLTIKEGTLAVGMDIAYPPLEYMDVDGKTPLGFDVDLAAALAKALGLKVVYVDTAWDGIFAGVNTGKYDVIISGVTMTEERMRNFTFTKPYIGNAMTIVVRADAPFTITKPEDIAGYRVTYQAETTANIYANQLAAQGVKFDAFGYDRVMNCFDELKFGRVDVVVVDSLVALEYLDHDAGLYKIVYQGPADETFGVCLKKGHDALAQKLNGALDGLYDSGELIALSQKHFKLDLVSNARN